MAQNQHIKFIQECAPVLGNGVYQITAEGSIDANGQKDSDQVNQTFVLSGERFSIPNSLVHSVFPPKGNTGNYQKVLPHIIFRNRELPWEQRINMETNEKCPWMALLVLEEGSGEELISVSLAELLDSEGGRRTVPYIQIEEENGEKEDDMCHVVDIPTEVFRKIAPRQSDLPYLAHVKQVALESKVTGETDMQDYFACLLGNRFCQSGDEAVQNHAYIVSLEGYEKMIQSEWEAIQGDTVRLVCLYDWSFFSKNDCSNDVKDIIEKLDVDTLQDRDAIYPLDCGYIPLNHQLKNGDRTVSWYRGPFLPVMVDFRGIRQYTTANEQIYFDPENGMMDVSYSAAWQLGKLFALMDDSFSRKLLTYNMEQHKGLMRCVRGYKESPDLNLILSEINELTETTGESRGIGRCTMGVKKIEQRKSKKN